MFKINLKPDLRQLRQFGFIAMAAFPLLAWLWIGTADAVLWSLAFSVLAGLLALIRPQWLGPVFITLSLVTLPIGIVVGELSLMFVYFGLIVPMGLVFKLMGRDALSLRNSPNQSSFWHRRKPSRTVRQYYRQS
jgi:hypothetical protein